LKKIEKELIQARLKAEESDRLKSAFLANMSHEIRTPLNGIIGFSKLLSNPDVLDNKRKMYSDIIERNSQQLLSLISDIIDIAKIESDQLKIYREHVNLNDLLDEIFQIFSNEMNNHADRDVKLYLQKDLKREQSFIVADRFRLAQLFNNLLSNAIKFTSVGHIEFGYRFSGKDFLFFVKDTGIGILPEKQKIIFEPFRQEDDTMTRQYGGTGLGLAICNKLTHLMGGKIWLESEKGVGSIFYFKLKLEFSEKPVVKAPELKTETIKWPGKNILVVDDNKDVLTYMNEILCDCDAKIITAESGSEAIDICNWAEKIDLILMDIQMPGMDGYAATREILKLYPDIPVVAQTAHAMAGDETK
jgi:signal transduction histidine kinase